MSLYVCVGFSVIFFVRLYFIEKEKEKEKETVLPYVVIIYYDMHLSWKMYTVMIYILKPRQWTSLKRRKRERKKKKKQSPTVIAQFFFVKNIKNSVVIYFLVVVIDFLLSFATSFV